MANHTPSTCAIRVERRKNNGQQKEASKNTFPRRGLAVKEIERGIERVISVRHSCYHGRGKDVSSEDTKNKFDWPIETTSSFFFFFDYFIVSCDPSPLPRDHSLVSRDQAISVGTTVHGFDFGEKRIGSALPHRVNSRPFF